MELKINPWIYHVILFLYCFAIFILSSVPGEDFPDVDFKFSDKIVHVIIYAILFSLFFYSLKNQSKYVRLQKFALEYSLLFTALYGITDELHQYFVPNRSCEFYDWLADVAGALILFIIFKITGKRNKSMIAVLLLLSAIAYSSPDNIKLQNHKPKIQVEAEESWLNLMPVIDDDRKNVFCFNIKLRFTGKLLDTNYTIKDFTIHLNNDKLKNRKINRQTESVTDSSFVLNLYQSPEEIYLDKYKVYPEEVKFTFKVMRNNRLIRSVKTHKIPILKTY